MSKILRPDPTSKKTGIPLPSIYEMIRKGQFPKPVRLSARRVGWLESELDEWIAARVAERDGKGAANASE